MYEAWLAGNTPVPADYSLYDTDNTNWQNTLTYRAPAGGRSVRSSAKNPNIRNLVILASGQSLDTNVSPTLYTATNASTIDNLNIYDGQIYDCAGPLLGCSYADYDGSRPTLGPGHVMLQVADLLRANNRFDHVTLVPLAIGNTSIAQHGTGIHANRTQVAMARLSARGIVPGMPGVTFADVMMIGHRDYADGTTQAAWMASYNAYQANLRATGYNGRSFVCSESEHGQTSNNIRSAQAAVRNGTTIYDGGDVDRSDIERIDGVHQNDAGRTTMATIIYNAMVASGAPF